MKATRALQRVKELPVDDSNRRIFPRMKRHVGVWYRSPGGTFRRGHTVELSVRGASVVVEEPLLGRPELELTFDLEPDWKVEAFGRPIWQQEMIPGVRFVVGVEYDPINPSYRHLMGPWLYRQIHAERKKRRGERAAAPSEPRGPELVPPILWSPASHSRRPAGVNGNGHTNGNGSHGKVLVHAGPAIRLVTRAKTHPR